MDSNRDRDAERKKGPRRDLGDIEDIVDRISRITGLGDFFRSEEGDGILTWKPHESDDPEIFDIGDALVVTVEIPEVSRDNIELFVGRNSLSIEVADEGFRRYVSLSQDVSSKGSKATFKNGVLDVTLKKA